MEMMTKYRSLFVILDEGHDIDAEAANLIMLWVALLRNLATQVSHSRNHGTEDIGVLLILAAFSQL